MDLGAYEVLFVEAFSLRPGCGFIKNSDNLFESEGPGVALLGRVEVKGNPLIEIGVAEEPVVDTQVLVLKIEFLGHSQNIYFEVKVGRLSFHLVENTFDEVGRDGLVLTKIDELIKVLVSFGDLSESGDLPQ